MLLSTYTSNRDNNFNLIRFVAASLVLYSHSFGLAVSGGQDPIRSVIGTTWGSIAVDVFFITSGFLITGSYLTRNNITTFVRARILRIYPALFVAIPFCVLLGAAVTTWSIFDYINLQTVRFSLKNTTLFFGADYHLPGVFLGNPENAINGSLWTLPYEIWMYTILMLTMFVLTTLGKRIKFLSIRNVIGALAVVAIMLHVSNKFIDYLPFHFFRLFAMFFVGSAFFVWKEKILLTKKWIYVSIPVIISPVISEGCFTVTYNFLLPFLIIYLAYIPSGAIRNFNRLGDYSYGIYIYAFPVQQSVELLWPNISVFRMMGISFGFTLLLAILSWHLVEKRFLQFKARRHTRAQVA